MPSTINEIEIALQEAISAGFRGRLLERGLARSMIWVNGELPEDAPQFSSYLSYDLLSYAYSILTQALHLKELGGDIDLSRIAFEKAALSLTDVLHNNTPNYVEKNFHNLLAASSYHLGGFSAKAFSLLNNILNQQNLSPIEEILTLLILRDFSKIESKILLWKSSGHGSDNTLALELEVCINKRIEALHSENTAEDLKDDFIEMEVINIAIADNYYSAIFEFLFALEVGSLTHLDIAVSQIKNARIIASELNMVPQWWILRITEHLLKDLWESSFHNILPLSSGQGDNSQWHTLRWIFIASLFKRSTAEIALWPSQLEGAHRAINDFDSLVVALPTSAGKTRIAELCILRCLSLGKRVLFITPLRALSAQTETSLRKTFSPLGKTVSSLYGSIGTSNFDHSVMASEDIIVGTPEKLDFALRNTPSLLDDVGLVVLDEGHMIGLNEREISYEVQIQRLLKRDDSDTRRIVCLSAILPSGDQFEDFVNWLRKDQEGQAIQSSWRPTDLRFGEILWQRNNGRINFHIGEEQPFIDNYIEEVVPPLPNPGLRTTPFPKNSQELTLASAWRLIQDGHTVLIYCPQRKSVNSFAKVIIDLYKRGALQNILACEAAELQVAKSIGSEWLGENHPIVQCLDIGVAIHHSALPSPFRKEMEKLLRRGILKITVSSPTLAQGLNLSATAILIHSLHRNGEILDPSEFKNVIGRAGRAFIDTHGLVLHPIFDRHHKRANDWRNLINNSKNRNMESGLLRLVGSLLQQIWEHLESPNLENLYEYIVNNSNTWQLPQNLQDNEEKHALWDKYLNSLDQALLSMLGDEDIGIENISEALEAVLQLSLWQRRLNRQSEESIPIFNSILTERAKYIWSSTTTSQRKSYFLAGVGLNTGKRLDDISQSANILLVNANIHIANKEEAEAIAAVTDLAELIFTIPPFVPQHMPTNWKDIIKVWLKGDSLSHFSISGNNDSIAFVEDALIYRLPWGIEALRVRAQAHGDVICDEFTIDDYETKWLLPALETGTLNRSASLLMQTGFNSRKAAIQAVTSTEATFINKAELIEWINDLDSPENWPTPDTSALWESFLIENIHNFDKQWKTSTTTMSAFWNALPPEQGTYIKLHNSAEGKTQILSTCGELLGNTDSRYELLQSGIYIALVNEGITTLNVTYWGQGETPFNLQVSF